MLLTKRRQKEEKELTRRRQELGLVFFDRAHKWLLTRYPELDYDIVLTGAGGKTLIVHEKNDKKKHLFSLDTSGSCWHRVGKITRKNLDFDFDFKWADLILYPSLASDHWHGEDDERDNFSVLTFIIESLRRK